MVVTAETAVKNLCPRELETSDAAGIDSRAVPVTTNTKKTKRSCNAPTCCQYRNTGASRSTGTRTCFTKVEVSNEDTTKVTQVFLFLAYYEFEAVTLAKQEHFHFGVEE